MANMVNLELRYGKEKHTSIRDALRGRRKVARDKLRDKYSRWEEDEKRHEAYMPARDADTIRNAARQAGMPQYTTIEIPFSYAMHLTTHMYWSGIFLSRNPIYELAETHGAGQNSAQAMEAMLTYQMRKGRIGGVLSNWLYDLPWKGVGVVGRYWSREETIISEMVEEDEMFRGVPLIGKKTKKKVTRVVPGYVGNRAFNVRPQDWWQDPGVSFQDFQSGEYCGRELTLSWSELVEGQAAGTYFNIDVVKKMNRLRRDNRMDEWSFHGLELPEIEDTADTYGGIPDHGHIDAYEIVVNLIPKDWRVGAGELPEKWVFVVALDEVVIRARPHGEYHGEYPYSLMEYELGGHRMYKRSLYEILEPLNNIATWLVNTHFFNIRKSLNNMFVVNPYKVRTTDLSNPANGLQIRLRQEARDTPVDQVFKQLNVGDVTRNHLSDMGMIFDLMQQVVGVNAMLMGQQEPGGRKTATEVRGSSQFSMNRLKVQAEFMAMMGWNPFAEQLVSSTQQYFMQEDSRWFKVAGDLLPEQDPRVFVDPELIQGQYDIEIVDGTMPVDKMALASIYKELIGLAGQDPTIAQTYNTGAMLAYTMQLLGAKNINRFKVEVRPDQDLLNAAQRGDVVPIGGQNDTSRLSQNPGGAESAAVRLAGPAATSGVGPLA